ncbi:MAG: hypothetical protein WC558_07625 [Patulibacter sp.]
MTERPYTAEDVDRAVREISEPHRLKRAEEIVTHAVPGLERIIENALHDGGWFSQGHQQQVGQAAAEPDLVERTQRIGQLVAEESRLAMLVGVTVGIALARELENPGTAAAEADDPETPEDEETPA